MGKNHYDRAVELCRAGKEFIDELRIFHKSELLYYKDSGVQKVQILTAGPGNSCEKCYKLHGKVLTIKEALRTMPLPIVNCTLDVFGLEKGFCRCNYAAEVG